MIITTGKSEYIYNTIFQDKKKIIIVKRNANNMDYQALEKDILSIIKGD